MPSLVTVSVPNEPGALAKVAATLSEGGVQVEGVQVVTRGVHGEAQFLVRDGRKALEALQSGGFPGKQEPVHVITLSNHQGALADVCQRLAGAGINIEGLFGTTYGKAGTLAMMTDDNVAAAKVLDQLSTE